MGWTVASMQQSIHGWLPTRVVNKCHEPSQTGRWACFFEVDSTVEEPSRTQTPPAAGLSGSRENLLGCATQVSCALELSASIYFTILRLLDVVAGFGSGSLALYSVGGSSEFRPRL